MTDFAAVAAFHVAPRGRLADPALGESFPLANGPASE